MNTRLNIVMLTVFSLTLRGDASPRLMQRFLHIVDLALWMKWSGFSLANRNCSVPTMRI
jgi:hypothetical protein